MGPAWFNQSSGLDAQSKCCPIWNGPGLGLIQLGQTHHDTVQRFSAGLFWAKLLYMKAVNSIDFNSPQFCNQSIVKLIAIWWILPNQWLFQLNLFKKIH